MGFLGVFLCVLLVFGRGKMCRESRQRAKIKKKKKRLFFFVWSKGCLEGSWWPLKGYRPQKA